MLEAKKDGLIAQWLERLDEKRRPRALVLLVNASPETSGLLNGLLSGGGWEEAVDGSLRELIRKGYGFQVLFLDRVSDAREALSRLLNSGELDEDLIRHLDKLLNYLASFGVAYGGDFLRVLLEAKRDGLIIGWLERLDKERRPPAFEILVTATPEINDLLCGLLSGGGWEEAAGKFMRGLISNCRASRLKVFLNNLPDSRKTLWRLLSSGKWDSEVIECLDELTRGFSSRSIDGGEHLLENLLKAKKDSLVVEWLEELNRQQRPHALAMLLKALPKASVLLKELLGDERWREAAVECKEQPTDYGITDELCTFLDTLLGHSEMGLEETE